MPFKKFANAEVADLITAQQWAKMQGGQAFRVGKTTKTAALKNIISNQTKYLLSHATIMASVATEPDPFDHWIKPESAHLVNNNQDAWTNEVLRLSYPTFRGAFNFLEHNQSTRASKGHILDAVLRKVNLTPTTFVYFCDILVATELIHEELVADIRSEKIKYMSMGCTTELVVCSFCGAHCVTEDSFCEHLLYRKGDFLLDEGGVARRVAELCGHKSLPGGGVAFIESSWVKTPACPASVKHSIVAEEWTGPKVKFASKLPTNLKVASVGRVTPDDIARFNKAIR